MKTILAPRASAILYDLLVAHRSKRHFLLPANVCPIVPLTFLKADVPFEFVDISTETLCMDLEAAQALLSANPDRYGGLLYVHTYGDSSTPNETLAVIKNRLAEFLLIDDRCLCVPELEPDHSSPADAILYSTGYGKIVDMGRGGFAFVRETAAYEHQVLPFQLQDLDLVEQDYKECIAARRTYTYKDSDWLQSDVEMPLWPRYAERVRNFLKISLLQRQNINAVYDALLPRELCLPQTYQLWRYNIRVDDNRRTLQAIFAAGLFASAHYASLEGILGKGSGACAADLAAHVVNLFNDHHYSLDMAEKTAQLIRGSL